MTPITKKLSLSLQMAGMLPGVECARRRRCHQSSRGGYLDLGGSGSGHGSSSRRSSFCLYTSNYESILTSSYSLQQRSSVNNNQGNHQNDEKLGGVAREAKERLDERLRAQRSTSQQPNNRNSSGQERLRYVEATTTTTTTTTTMTTISSSIRDLQRGLKKSGSKRFSWAKLGWKATEQEECAICLEQFKSGGGSGEAATQQVVDLPCAHRFHSRCLVPWLATNAHCPCCRMEIWGN